MLHVKYNVKYEVYSFMSVHLEVWHEGNAPAKPKKDGKLEVEARVLGFNSRRRFGIRN